MAQRILVPQKPSSLPWIADPRRRGLRREPLDRARLRQSLWQVITAPYWIGSDVPPPHLPAREVPRPLLPGRAGEQVVRTLDRIGHRLWMQRIIHILVRAAWLGLAVGCLWLLIELQGGPALRATPLIGISAALIAMGVIFAALQRPTRRQVARMLDRSFLLKERLTTAVDHLGQGVPADGQQASVVYLQMADAANVVAEIRSQPALGIRVPVREVVLAIAFGLVMAGLAFLRGVGGDIPPAAAGAVPAFTAAADRPPPAPAPAAPDAGTAPTAPTVEEVRAQAQRSNDALRDLNALGQALADHAVTRSAADAIARGDYADAGDDLRNLAPDADQLSPSAREELATDLDQAASHMAPGSADLSAASRQAADGLRQGDTAAEQSVRELGDQVEASGQLIAPQEDLARQMRQAQAAKSSSSTSDGQQGQSPQGDQSGSDSQPGSDRQAANAGQPGQSGEQQPGQAGQPGSKSGDSPGNQAQGGESGQSEPGEGQPGGQPGQSPAGGEPGQKGQPGASGQPGDPRNGEPGDGQGDQREQSGKGSGAGGGEADQAAAAGQSGDKSAGGDQAGEGDPADQQVSNGDGKAQAAGDPAPVDATMELPQVAGEDAIQTSPDGGGSNRGTGAGVTAGSGTAVQGEVGEAGPDSNRVPPAYRSLVERYFTEGDTP